MTSDGDPLSSHQVTKVQEHGLDGSLVYFIYTIYSQLSQNLQTTTCTCFGSVGGNWSKNMESACTGEHWDASWLLPSISG